MAPNTRTRIEALTDAETAQMDAWADQWIAHGLNTAPADRPRFEAAAADCYRFAGYAPAARIVWVPSPMVLSLAAPLAAFLLEQTTVTPETVATIAAQVGRTLKQPEARIAAVTTAVFAAMGRDAPAAVPVPTKRLPLVAPAVAAIKDNWARYLGGQFWVGGWWGPAWSSFFREVCHLTLPGDLWDRGRAYEATTQSACWWWPHTQFIMVSERPVVIHRELVNPEIPRGWGSHRLHCATGPAVLWPDGWAIYAWHGVRVKAPVIETPAHEITGALVHDEPNAEVRRVLMARMGMARYLTESKATPIQADDWGRLFEITIDAERTMRVVRVVNGTPEGTWVETGRYTLDLADGDVVPEPERTFVPSTEPREDCEQARDGMWYKVYWLRVPSRVTTAREAVAWTNWHDDPNTYEEVIRT